MSEISAPLPTGSVIGILGGGQLGRMLIPPAARLGYRCAVFSPEEDCPASHLTDRCIVADYTDMAALERFAGMVDVVTFEFENIPLASVERLAALRPVRPGPAALAQTQDRLTEKRFLNETCGIPTARCRAIDGPGDIAAAIAALGAPLLLKTRRMGYDGKGQVRISADGDPAQAWESLGRAPAIAEAVVPFDREISVVLARGADGRTVAYPPGENRHAGGILRRTHLPAGIPDALAARASEMARRVAAELDYIGVLALEMFVTDGPGEVLANEIAPRVHNTGHWTLDGAVTDQFEQHIRAIAGLPLGAPDALGRVRMENLIGADIERRADLLADPRARVHDYGKGEARPGRKMGHVTWLDAD